MSNNYLGQPHQNQPVIIINNNNNMMNDSIDAMPNAKPAPQNALEYLSEDTLESKAKLNFIKKVYMILICTLSTIQASSASPSASASSPTTTSPSSSSRLTIGGSRSSSPPSPSSSRLSSNALKWEGNTLTASSFCCFSPLASPTSSVTLLPYTLIDTEVRL